MKDPNVQKISKFRPNKPAPIPRGLARHGRALWKELTAEYHIVDAGGRASLVSACRAEDDIQRLRAIVAADGDIIVDRFHQKQPHPLLTAISRAETAKRQALAALHLDLEPLADQPGKPLGSH